MLKLTRLAQLTMAVVVMIGTMEVEAQSVQDYFLLVGTYSSPEKPNGIHVIQFNASSGEWQVAQPFTELRNASYLCVSKDQQHVYAVSEAGGGSVNAYSFDSRSGALTFMNSVPSAGPCYVSVDDQKKLVFAGNYGGGNVLAAHLHSDGSIKQESTQVIQHEGNSVVKDRQDKPHVHAAVLSGNNEYLMVPDLGVDRVYQYRVNATQSQPLAPASPPFLSVSPGGGPRHLAFHPGGKLAYLVLELQGAVLGLDFNDGSLTARQTISMTDKKFGGRVSGADIHVSPDGRFLYASNRGDADEIAIYSIDAKGKLKLQARQSVLGKTPRNFAIDPTGNFLLVANQNSGNVVIFRRNPETGLLTPTGKEIAIDKPVCLKFTPVRAPTRDEAMLSDALEKFRNLMINPDTAALAGIAADDLQYVHSSGTVRNKQGFVDEFTKRWTNFTSVTISHQTISVTGDNAIVRHRLQADANNPGYPSNVDIFVLMVWRKESGSWKLLARQATKVSQ
jgi:6-phosphogluconolactonase